MNSGRIDITNLSAPPETAELMTARYFAALGKDVSFIRPSSIPHQHSADILMDGLEWEIKCPEGKSKRTIENNIRKAMLQSHNIIFDLRHLKSNELQCITQLEQQFNRRNQIKKLYIIKKNGELLEYKRRR